MVCFFSTSVANETENLNICRFKTKPMGENTITNIMKAGTSLKEREKKVYKSLCEKNHSQEAKESKEPCHCFRRHLDE